MCPFDLSLHHEENHLDKQGRCKFIALIWIPLLRSSRSAQNPEDLFRITQNPQTRQAHIQRHLSHFPLGKQNSVDRFPPRQYKYEHNSLLTKLTGNLSRL